MSNGLVAMAATLGVSPTRSAQVAAHKCIELPASLFSSSLLFPLPHLPTLLPLLYSPSLHSPLLPLPSHPWLWSSGG